MPFPSNYQPNNIIQANDLIQAIGAYGTGTGYTSDLDAQQKIGALWGIGWGTRGYGQTSPSLTPPAVGDIVAANVWSDLRQILFVMAQHHNGTPTPSTSLPLPSVFVSGALVQAHVPPNFDLPAQLVIADNNRNTFASPAAALASCEIVSSVLTITRTTNWGLGSSGITATVDVSWIDEDQARYFFNSGGLINLNFVQTNTGNAKSADWSNIFATKIGTLSFGFNSTSWTGSWPGSPVNIGYYQLTNTPITVFNGANIGNGVYNTNDVFVNVHYVGALGPRGGRSNVIRFTLQLIDENIGPYEQPVLAGTAAIFGYRRAITYLSGIPVPTFNIVAPF